MSENETNEQESGMTRAASAAGHVRGALKTGKAVSGAAKGAAGPFGWALFAVENRKVIGRIAAVMAAFLLLPVIIIEMLPGVLFGGLSGDGKEENGSVKKAVFEDTAVIAECLDTASAAVDSVMTAARGRTVAEIYRDFARYGPNDRMMIVDGTAPGDYDSGRIVCDYSAATDPGEEIDIGTMRGKLETGLDRYYFYTVTETPGRREEAVTLEDGSWTTVEVAYTTVTYTVLYIGDEYLEDDVLGMTEEQKKLSADYADSLTLIR